MKEIKVAKWAMWLIAFAFFVIGAGFTTVIAIETIGIPDDPPKPEKEIKKDTTQINLQQLQEINETTNKRSLFLDSLIMKIDTLNKKK